MWLITLKLQENDIMAMLIGYSHHKNKHSSKTFTSEVHLQALKLVLTSEGTMRGCQSLSSPHVIPHTSLHTLTSLSQPWKHSHTPLKYLLSATVKKCDMEPEGVHTHIQTHTHTHSHTHTHTGSTVNANDRAKEDFLPDILSVKILFLFTWQQITSVFL